MQFELNKRVGDDFTTITLSNNPVKLEFIFSLSQIFQRLGGYPYPKDQAKVWRFPFITSWIIEVVIHNTCFVCGGLMKDGEAIQEGKMFVPCSQGTIEYPYPKDSTIAKVRKCLSCGHSHT